MNTIPHEQISALRAFLNKATPDGLRRGGLVFRTSEGEMLIVQLTALLRTLELYQ